MSAEPKPSPQPERAERELAEPVGLRDLSRRDYVAIVVRAAREAIDDRLPDVAAALAYYLFLALPALLLLAVGLFSVFADPASIETIVEKVGPLLPGETTQVVEEQLGRVIENQTGGIVAIVAGGLLALWTATSAMTALIRALNVAYEVEESRGFVKQRLVAFVMLVFLLLALVLVFGLLVLGPVLSGWIGGLIGLETVFEWIWWTAQWPVLVVAILFAFAVVLHLGPNVSERRWQFLTLGAAVALVLWLAASGAFAFYVSNFDSYNKTWGSVAAVIIMLIWLWLSSLALLFGAEINAEARRSRALRKREPLDREAQAQAGA